MSSYTLPPTTATTTAAQAMPPTQPIPVPKPALAPSKSEIERKLSLRSVSPQTRDSIKKSVRRPTNPPPPGSFPPPILTPSTATGYESDSSYVSSQPNFTTAQPSTASPSLLTGTSIRDTGLSAIVERDQEGVIALSDEEEEEEEGDEQSEEDEVRRPDAGEMRKGVEGERVVKSGYLLKKGERRKNWKKRWFVLRTEKMAYYKDEKEYVLCRILDLRDIHTVASVQLKRHPFGFGIVTPKRTYYVEASSHAEMEAWILAMNEVRRNLAEKDERARQQEPTASTGLATTSSMQPSSLDTNQHGKLAGLQIPRRDSASQTQGVTTMPMTPTGNAISPFRSSPSPLDSLVSKMTITSPHSASPVDRSREVQDRVTSSRRDTSASSVSSIGQQIPHPDLAFATDNHMAGITSSDEDDLYPPQVSVPHPSSPLIRDHAQIQTDPNKVILSGYLMKLGFRRKVWRKRWFVLTSGMFVYTKSHMDPKIHRQIPISIILDALEWESPSAPIDIDASSDSSPETHRRLPFSVPNTTTATTIGGGGGGGGGGSHVQQHTFQVITPKRTFKLCAPTEEDEIKWLAALRTLINRERERIGFSPGTRRGSSGGGGLLNASSHQPHWSITHSSQPSGTQLEYGLGNVNSTIQPHHQIPVPTIQEFPPTPIPSSSLPLGSGGDGGGGGITTPLPLPTRYQSDGQTSYFPLTTTTPGEESESVKDSQSFQTISGKNQLSSVPSSSYQQPTIQSIPLGSPSSRQQQPQQPYSSSSDHQPLPSSTSPLYPTISTTSTTTTTNNSSSTNTSHHHHRARSATQSAKAAVEMAVKKLHLGQGQSSGQHGHLSQGYGNGVAGAGGGLAGVVGQVQERRSSGVVPAQR